MIRRDLKLADGSSNWLLVSQVEHARLSGTLAQHWIAADLSPYECDGRQLPSATTDEVLAAVTHHDDGWARWEAAPQIDPNHGRPYSFMNELPLADRLEIWTRSVAAARAIGPLAGWMVAGHFSELLQIGNHTGDARAAEWLREQHSQRDLWLHEWLRTATPSSPRIAERALRLLQACDFLSLWLCCDCPLANDEAVGRIEPFRLHRPAEAIGPYEFSAYRDATCRVTAEDAFANSGWAVAAHPWPFHERRVELTASGWLLRAQRLRTTQQLVQERRPVTLRWAVDCEIR